MNVRTAAILGLAMLLALMITSCADAAPDSVPARATDMDTAESSAIALVQIGGTIDSVSPERLVLQDSEGHLVHVRIEHAEGPVAQFCDNVEPVPMCRVLSDASPSAGEFVCVQARLSQSAELVARFVILDSRCATVRSPTAVPTP